MNDVKYKEIKLPSIKKQENRLQFDIFIPYIFWVGRQAAYDVEYTSNYNDVISCKY